MYEREMLMHFFHFYFPHYHVIVGKRVNNLLFNNYRSEVSFFSISINLYNLNCFDLGSELIQL